MGRRTERVAGGPDRLVRLLRVLHLRGVDARGVGEVLRTVELASLRPGCRDRRLRQRRGVRAHVGDVAVLVEPLGDRHRPRGAEAELATGLLLQRRRTERRIGPAGVRLRLDRAHHEVGVAQGVGERLRPRLGQVDDLGGVLQLAVRTEVAASRHPGLVDRVQLGGEHPLVVLLAGVEGALEIPVRRDPEPHPLTLTVDHESGCDGLHPTGGETGHHLAPEDRADLVAVEAVEDAARLLGLDQVHVDLAGALHCGVDRARGDLVEHHPADRHLGVELVEEVPGDRLALTVLVSGEEELVGFLEQALELGHVRLLVARDDVHRLEAVVDVDAQACPGLALQLRGDVRRALWEVTDVADGGLHDEVRPEVTRDGAGLGR